MTTLKHPKWVKLGTLLKTPENKLKINSLATARAQKEKPKAKTTRLPPVKRFLYSHIARLSYLIFRMGKDHVDTCTSVPLPSSLENVPYISCVETET